MYKDVHFLPSLRLICARALSFQNGQGCPWFHPTATFLLRKNSRPEVYTDVHFWTGYFQKAYGRGIYFVAGFKQLSEKQTAFRIAVCAALSLLLFYNFQPISSEVENMRMPVDLYGDGAVLVVGYGNRNRFTAVVFLSCKLCTVAVQFAEIVLIVIRK